MKTIRLYLDFDALDNGVLIISLRADPADGDTHVIPKMVEAFKNTISKYLAEAGDAD